MQPFRGYTLSFAALTTVIGACTTEVDFDELKVGDVIAVNSLMTASAKWEVTLSYPVPLSQPGIIPNLPSPEGTVVVVQDESGVTIENLQRSADRIFHFVGQKSPDAGNYYNLIINIPNQAEIRARGFVPVSVPIENHEVDSSRYLVDEHIKVALTYTDPAGEENFYRVRVLKHIGGETGDELIGVQAVDPALNTRTSGTFELLLEDSNFDGQRTELLVLVSGSGYRQVSAPVEIHLEHISRDFYLYLTTKNLQVNTNLDPFAQPVQVYSNIQNGVGVFSGFALSGRALN